MTKKRILVIEKDLSICAAIKECMQDGKTDIDCADSLLDMLANFLKQDYCLLIIGIYPAEQRELELLQQVQGIRKVPILALTTPLNAKEKITLFQVGVDAYIEKPIDVAVCKAQADALIQLFMKSTYEISGHTSLAFGTELIIEPHYRQVIVNGQPLTLTKKEFDLLYYLARHPGQVFSREHLYDCVWQDNSADCGVDTVKTHIKNLRKKLALAQKSYIQNVWGAGYKFVFTNTY